MAKSFMGSLVDGGIGYVKGLVTGGVVGVVAGAVIGGLLGIVGGPGGMVAGAMGGALFLGVTFATIGSIAGSATQVVKGREAGSYSAADVSRTAHVAFAQGVQVGQNLSPEQEQTTFRDRIEAERAANAIMSNQRIH